MSRNKKKNTIYNTIKSLFGIIYPLITFPYISRVLQAENVGKINFSNSIVSYFSLIASLGITTYAIRECSKVRHNKEELSKLASQIMSINILSTAIAYFALVITLIFARPLENYRLLICIQSSAIIFSTFGAEWINMVMEDFKFIAIRTVAMQVISLILMFVFIHKPEDYIIYAIISVVASSGANIINIFYRGKYCKIKFTTNLDLKRHLPPIILMFSMLIAQIIYVNSDMTILGLIRNDIEVGLYSTSVKIYNIVNTIIASIAYVVMPQLSEGFARNDYEDINRILKYALNFIIVLGLPCLVGLNVIASSLIYVIAGKEYLGATTSLHILTIALLFSFIGGWIANLILIPAGKEKVCLRTGIISAVLNVVLNLILIPKYGLNAAAFTTMLAELNGLLLVRHYIDKNVKITGFTEMVKAPIVGSLTILAIGICARHFFENPFIISISTILVSGLAYGIILVIMKNEFFLGFLAPIIRKMRGIKK